MVSVEGRAIWKHRKTENFDVVRSTRRQTCNALPQAHPELLRD